MFPVLPMFVPEIVGVDGAEDEAGDNDVDGQSAPEVCKHKFVVSPASSKVGAPRGGSSALMKARVRGRMALLTTHQK